MSTSKKQIGKWLVEAKEYGNKYIVIFSDTFDYSDYPVYFKTKEGMLEGIKIRESEKMTKVMEIYDLSLSIKKQLDEKRAWNV
jgi:hypothetical protein